MNAETAQATDDDLKERCNRADVKAATVATIRRMVKHGHAPPDVAMRQVSLIVSMLIFEGYTITADPYGPPKDGAR